MRYGVLHESLKCKFHHTLFFHILLRGPSCRSCRCPAWSRPWPSTCSSPGWSWATPSSRRPGAPCRRSRPTRGPGCSPSCWKDTTTKKTGFVNEEFLLLWWSFILDWTPGFLNVLNFSIYTSQNFALINLHQYFFNLLIFKRLWTWSNGSSSLTKSNHFIWLSWDFRRFFLKIFDLFSQFFPGPNSRNKSILANKNIICFRSLLMNLYPF